MEPTSTPPPQREMFYCTAKPHNKLVDLNAPWELEHKQRTRCPGCNGWRKDVPVEPIFAVLNRPPPAIVTSTGLFMIAILELAELFVQHGRAMLGPVFLKDGRELLEWRTLYAIDENCLEAERGRYNRHSACHKCGRLRRNNGWAHPVIAQRYLDDRWFYLGKSAADAYIDRRLIEQENLKTKYPTLRLYPVPIIPEPEDGQIMPGDPGWTGTFVRLPLPVPPKTPPVKGMGLWL